MPTLPLPRHGHARAVSCVVAALLLSLSSSPAAQATQTLFELDEPALSAVSAQGLVFPAQDQEPAELPLPLRLFSPLFAYLDADVQTRGAPATRTILHADGTLELQVTGSIEEIRLDNLRVHGAPVEQRFGSLRFEDMNFAGSSVRIRQLP